MYLAHFLVCLRQDARYLGCTDATGGLTCPSELHERPVCNFETIFREVSTGGCDVRVRIEHLTASIERVRIIQRNLITDRSLARGSRRANNRHDRVDVVRGFVDFEVELTAGSHLVDVRAH